MFFCPFYPVESASLAVCIRKVLFTYIGSYICDVCFRCIGIGTVLLCMSKSATHHTFVFCLGKMKESLSCSYKNSLHALHHASLSHLSSPAVHISGSQANLPKAVLRPTKMEWTENNHDIEHIWYQSEVFDIHPFHPIFFFFRTKVIKNFVEWSELTAPISHIQPQGRQS